jgi:hypothetical protein
MRGGILKQLAKNTTLQMDCRLALGPANPYSFFRTHPCGTFYGSAKFNSQGAAHMDWTTPQHEEIELNCEVSSYANAEL